jgi:hypothetical protein
MNLIRNKREHTVLMFKTERLKQQACIGSRSVLDNENPLKLKGNSDTLYHM